MKSLLGPDVYWQLRLSRIADLRIPSEALTLSWGDLDWDKGRMTVHSPKTVNHAGNEHQKIPLFPEVREYIVRLWSVPSEGSTVVFSRFPRVSRHSETGWQAVNPQTMFLKLLRRAGVAPLAQHVRQHAGIRPNRS